jgi:hypothetical protein
MEAWQAVTLAVVALLVGMTLPALVQLSLALRALRTTTARADAALVAVTSIAQRLDRMTARLEEGDRLDRLLAGVDTLSRAASHLADGVRFASAVGAALGPAVGAAVRSWHDTRPAGAQQGTDGAAPHPEREGASP